MNMDPDQSDVAGECLANCQYETICVRIADFPCLLFSQISFKSEKDGNEK